MAKETSKSIARLAARFLSGELRTLTRKQQLSVCASCVSQAEREQESVKAWGGIDKGHIWAWATEYKKNLEAEKKLNPSVKPIRVLITPITRPADKRLTKRKRG